MSFEEWRESQRGNINGYTERDGYEAGAASRQDEVDDLLELNRLYKIALQQSVNRTSSFVHEKIISLELKIKGQNNE